MYRNKEKKKKEVKINLKEKNLSCPSLPTVFIQKGAHGMEPRVQL
jgi:hypothetical protein